MTRPRLTKEKTRTATHQTPQKRDKTSRQVTAVIGGVLIVVAVLWFAWLLARQANPTLRTWKLPLPGFLAQNTPTPQVDPLIAAGINLSLPVQGQEPRLTQEQALLLANQMEPEAAATAAGIDERYALFSYTNADTSQPSFAKVPVWVIHYKQLPEPLP